MFRVHALDDRVWDELTYQQLRPHELWSNPVDTMVRTPVMFQRPRMFDECPEVVPLLVAQSLIGLLMDAIFLNLMYTRFSTAFTRSASIIFTDVAIVYEENGFVKIAFRVCEVGMLWL